FTGTSSVAPLSIDAASSAAFVVKNGGSTILNVNSSTSIISTRHLNPNATNTYDLGSASLQYRNCFLQNAVTVSDRRKKFNIKKEELGLNFINKLNPVTFQYIGAKNVIHGLISQDVEKTLEDLDIHHEIYLYDRESDSYHLKYTELISILVKAIQELST
ncbi:MAG: tail fiber domain-containing protein, partial [Nanoarchaeota archaeon]